MPQLNYQILSPDMFPNGEEGLREEVTTDNCWGAIVSECRV